MDNEPRWPRILEYEHDICVMRIDVINLNMFKLMTSMDFRGLSPPLRYHHGCPSAARWTASAKASRPKNAFFFKNVVKAGTAVVEGCGRLVAHLRCLMRFIGLYQNIRRQFQQGAQPSDHRQGQRSLAI